MFAIIKLISFVVLAVINLFGWLLAYPTYVLFNIIDSRSLKEAWHRSNLWGHRYGRNNFTTERRK